MPRYFFDIHDGQLQRDEDGTECADFDAARREAMISLPDVARWEIPSDGDRQSYTVIVRDAAGAPIYTATLTFTGLRLSEAAE
ncbi:MULTISPECIES: DUF6894 family protein [Methylobacterium]|uniref:DUF6894 domain-containing protein n=1 Tax=Methylobacterium radiotolerans (strain ATCC 27329 / DSM 1819 / JCM 2831 / NBRC 15690 / NCIMB 10815 / 0-1) TaxID=426355 RepID=B1M8J1_METRJ|nr:MULTISPECIES: hypothetical protein [Methylobacterium]ACB27816.1 conserved hypothetical protein [Methylobacterium radiotolerans JCM 2831]MBY0397866.1 hypothetical protein [Thermoleophilia bacterium]RUP20581.1 MAG: hypothetical protein EKK44_13765 [Methylobacterium sp.]GEM99721.1 hypothetical protein MRA01_42610 [Methylobacterium radiotolerans]